MLHQIKKWYKLFYIILLSSVVNNLFSQIKLPIYPDSLFSTYYEQRFTHFKTLPFTKNDIIFLGNSITDGAEWSELFVDNRVKNRGISGDFTAGVINRLDEITARKPAKVFLLIGVNDLARNVSADSIVKNILFISNYLKQETPSTKLYIQSILPVNDGFGKFNTHTNKGEQIKQINFQLKLQANKREYTFIDLYNSFCDNNGKLKSAFTNDGLHLKGEGYLLWKHLIYPYLYDVQKMPALIPLPQQIKWQEGIFSLFKCETIVIKDKTLTQEATELQQYLIEKGLHATIVSGNTNKLPAVELELGQQQNNNETYSIKVTPNKVVIKAFSAHGIFNGIQTFYQLMRDNTMIDACEIQDWPEFAWRGYMVDVGRNYQSLPLLKQQIDVMGKYKLNVFHFHATEDIAWRIAIKSYPQLTESENMLRDKGMYYGEVDIKELIEYCKVRHILFLPEIDLPGHSAAFIKAMHTTMQTDSGIIILKNILKEFCTTYGIGYLHIGGDEVKITNKNVIPEITKYLDSLGIKTVGWSPGGNLNKSTLQQLWMGNKIEDSASPYIDSRHLYLNHLDPLEAVTTIYFRQIGNKTKGDSVAKGATLCLWNDRRVENQDDVLKMNPVYPGMLTFAEKCWRGGGKKNWVTNITDTVDLNEFISYENRLIDHQTQFFKCKPFPYVKQSDVTWQLFGPYLNGGDLGQKFRPEEIFFSEANTKPTKQASGGTIVLRHWWAPMVKAVLDDPKENTTWYATTKIWSNENAEQSFWIGFNNFSRSTATDEPPNGCWDNKQSAVWVNGNAIAPPNWRHAGQKADLEIPLADEGYEYREPTKIMLQKGWNTVLIKCPIGSFKGKDWQNPVKWMFTFIPVNKY